MIFCAQASEIVQQYHESPSQEEPFSEEKGRIKFSVRRDASDASKKLELRIGASQFQGLGESDIARRNLLKGVTANESTTIHVNKSSLLLPIGRFLNHWNNGSFHIFSLIERFCLLQDTASLGLVFVRHRGYVVMAEAAGPVIEGDNVATDVEVDEQPDGGANAMNVNR